MCAYIIHIHTYVKHKNVTSQEKISIHKPVKGKHKWSSISTQK